MVEYFFALSARPPVELDDRVRDCAVGRSAEHADDFFAEWTVGFGEDHDAR
jgi:hypothetical protein